MTDAAGRDWFRNDHNGCTGDLCTGIQEGAVSISLETAHRLAHFIENTHAKDRCSLLRRGRFKPEAHEEFDPLAATCLGNLIYDVANGGNKNFGE